MLLGPAFGRLFDLGRVEHEAEFGDGGGELGLPEGSLMDGDVDMLNQIENTVK